MIQKQAFGRTGHQSSRIIFGAAALGQVTQLEADKTLELLLSHGVNHIDAAASYGEAELRIGPWMAAHRKEFFLATKTGQRTYEAARVEIHQSLERLRVDHVDLLQLHCLIDPKEWDTAFAEDGALEALIEARDEGLTRFLGVTGHTFAAATMHQRALARFDFDSVLLPYSHILMRDASYRAEFEALLARSVVRGVAVQTIKALVRRPWPSEARTRATWYEPLEDSSDIALAAHWVLARPELFLNSVGDIHVLPALLEAAERFDRAPSESEMSALVARAAMEPLFT
jgi:aryl-alcohol dehydrogenase-like predicted oxidoreductase